jgi:two-component system, response regulator PdtaR
VGTSPAHDAFPQMEKQKTVLIVDDEPGLRTVVRFIVEDARFRTKEAASADEALQILYADGINVVLTDIEMPGSLDGLALAKKIRSKWQHVKVILMSGRTLPRRNELPDETQILAKPFSPDRLMYVIQEAL